MSVVEIFKALGESTRLTMVERLSTGKTFTLTTLSEGLKISRQGARKHLKILEDAQLIILKGKGRDTFVLLDQKTFETSKKFIAKLEKQWDARLEKLKLLLEKEESY